MVIGVPGEIKQNEFRVSLTPHGAGVLVSQGHGVVVESGAGSGSGLLDDAYRESGAGIVADAAAVYHEADLVLKVKEILPPEYALLREGQIVFTYLHSAANPEETQVLLDRKVIAIAYEDVETDDGRTPLLAPMSEIAGEVGLLLGACHMLTTNGGSGILMGGAVGIEPARVVVLGAGNVGLGAARYAIGLGADVTLMDIDLEKLREVRRKIFPQVKTLVLNEVQVREVLPHTDLLINAVKWPPGCGSHIVTRDMLRLMKRDALIVDISCDPAGAIETCRRTSHDDPVYMVDGVRHLCVDNLPSAAARTASAALCNHTLPYVLEIASKGWLGAVKDNVPLRRGLGFAMGYLTFRPTAEAQGREYTSPEAVIEMFS